MPFSRRIVLILGVVAAVLASATAASAAQIETDLSEPQIYTPYIVNGSDLAGPKPWLAAVMRSDVSDAFDAQQCTGSLVAPNAVLTAAHCLDIGAPLDVSVGVLNLDNITAGDRLDVINRIYHPGWVDNDGVDLGVLILERAVAGVTPVRVDPVQVVAGDEATAYGWGALDNNGNYPSKAQVGSQTVYTDVYNTSDCGFAPGVVDMAHQFCSKGDSGNCSGDSGGPVVGVNKDPSNDRDLLIGVVSGGGSTCLYTQAGDIDERILDNVDWLESAIGRSVLPCQFNAGSRGDTYDAWKVPCWLPASRTSPFTDVTSATFYDGVRWLYANKITLGLNANTYGVGAGLDRGQMVTFLWRFADEPSASPSSFSDVPSSAYFKPAVDWAAQYGITLGTSSGQFQPSVPVSRAQMVTFLWRLVDEPGAAPAAFSDVPKGVYYESAVAWASETGVTNGVGGNKFGPDQPVTRDQMAAFLFRLANQL